MSNFVPNNRHLREVLIFLFHWKKTAAQAHRELQKVYGNAALSETTCRDWFRRFKDGDFDVDDRPREGRPKTFEDAKLEALLEEDSCQTQEELASELGVTRQAVSKRLHALGMIQKQGTWVPYGLTLPSLLKPTWARSNGKSYPTRHIPQILRRPIFTCSVRWHMAWLISSSAHMKTSENGLIRG